MTLAAVLLLNNLGRELPKSPLALAWDEWERKATMTEGPGKVQSKFLLVEPGTLEWGAITIGKE
jgi:hypothetical protein